MFLSAGRARPMEVAIRRWGSRVEFSLKTTKVTWPCLSSFSPSVREMSLQWGGKMLETRTRLQAAMPTERSASSKLDSRSRCFPTPLVRKIFLATNILAGAHHRARARSVREAACFAPLVPRESVAKILDHYAEEARGCQSLFARGVFRIGPRGA